MGDTQEARLEAMNEWLEGICEAYVEKYFEQIVMNYLDDVIGILEKEGYTVEWSDDK